MDTENAWSCGENVAYNMNKDETTAWKVINQWNYSEGHRANMISDDFSHVGVAAYKKNGYWWWTQLFFS